MMTRVSHAAVALFSFLCATVCFAVYVGPMGNITYYQPDSTSFQAQWWGDEFEWHMETSDGYAIIRNPNDSTYYYAQLDSTGDYTWTDLVVGVDDPSGQTLHLDRSASKKAEIDSTIEAFIDECEAARENFVAWQDTSSRSFKDVMVLLVALTDRRPNLAYRKYQFENMLNSFGYYNTYTSPPPHVTSPDGEDVCGSVRDYFNEVSGNRFEPHYTVINTETQNVLTWIELPGASYQYYFSNLCTDAINAAIDNYGWDLSGYDNLCVIVAGYWVDGSPSIQGVVNANYTNPRVLGLVGAYRHDERWRRFNGNPPYTFSHPGIHCHEYGHVLGLSFDDIGANNDARQFMLMGTGNNPGPQSICESPSHMGVAEKLNLNWVKLTAPNQELFDITENTQDLVIPYRTNGHRWYHRFTCPNGDKFLLENRRYDGTGGQAPYDRDFNSYITGHDRSDICPRNMLFVHRVWGTNNQNGDFLCADNFLDTSDPTGFWWYGDWGDPFPGKSGVDSLSPLSPEVSEQWPLGLHYYHTTPKDHNGHQTGFALFNISSETDGIHADVYHNYWAGDINTNTTWSGTDIIVGGSLHFYIDDHGGHSV
jgi:M6 family metalloprotease-like protein